MPNTQFDMVMDSKTRTLIYNGTRKAVLEYILANIEDDLVLQECLVNPGPNLTFYPVQQYLDMFRLSR